MGGVSKGRKRDRVAHADLVARPRYVPGPLVETSQVGPAIVFLNRFFYPDESATAQMLSDLAFDLAAKGQIVRVIASRLHSGARELLPTSEVTGNLEIFRVASRAQFRPGRRWKLLAYLSFYPSAFVALLRYLRKGDVLVVKTDPPLVVVVAWVAARLKGATFVTWLQDLYPEVAIALKAPLFGGRVLGTLLMFVRNFVLKQARANVVIGKRMAAVLEAEGVAARMIHIIPNWADEQAITPIPSSQSQLRKSLNAGPDTFVVSYSGNLGRAHEFKTLLGAATRLKHRDIRFLFIGGGVGYDMLRTSVRKRGLTNFHFMPHQPREQLADSLGAADAHWLSLRPELEGLIVPSKFYGILAAGRAVLAVSAPSGEVASEVRTHGCGYVIEPRDEHELASRIEFLADNRAVCSNLGEVGRRLAETRFSRQSALSAWSQLFDALKITAAGSPAGDAARKQENDVSQHGESVVVGATDHV